jgi:hypothetical protein
MYYSTSALSSRADICGRTGQYKSSVSAGLKKCKILRKTCIISLYNKINYKHTNMLCSQAFFMNKQRYKIIDLIKNPYHAAA